MYVRPSHRPRTDDDILRILREHMFATMVTSSPAGIVATHLPFVFEDGVLYAHMARANQQSETVDAGEALVMFQGPHAYISPSWYEDRATAPTWDYIAVHCYGTPRVHSSEETIRNIERLIAVVEAPQARPWSLNELSEQEVSSLLRNVVSFEIPVTRMEAKFKLNQGEKTERTAAAIGELERRGDRELADSMRRYNDMASIAPRCS
jgi:transcriptional regulator